MKILEDFLCRKEKDPLVIIGSVLNTRIFQSTAFADIFIIPKNFKIKQLTNFYLNTRMKIRGDDYLFTK